MININQFIVESLTDFPHSSRSTAQWKELQANCEETLEALKNDEHYKSLSKLIDSVSSMRRTIIDGSVNKAAFLDVIVSIKRIDDRYVKETLSSVLLNAFKPAEVKKLKSDWKDFYNELNRYWEEATNPPQEPANIPEEKPTEPPTEAPKEKPIKITDINKFILKPGETDKEKLANAVDNAQDGIILGLSEDTFKKMFKKVSKNNWWGLNRNELPGNNWNARVYGVELQQSKLNKIKGQPLFYLAVDMGNTDGTTFAHFDDWIGAGDTKLVCQIPGYLSKTIVFHPKDRVNVLKTFIKSYFNKI
jgi:hypothetical protein